MMLLLVSEDATKTRRAGVAKLTKEALAGGGRQEELRAALEHLERHRIVRRLPGEGEDAFLLHHDYLARGVREAFRQANRWSEYLREKAVELNTAFGWRQRWRALVPLTMQVRLVLERLRRRFEYGEHRRLAILSTLRMIPLLLVIALLGAVAWWVDRVREELVVAEVVAGIGHGDSMSSVEDAALNRLGFSSERARLYALRLMVSTPDNATRGLLRVDSLVHIAVRLDPTRDRPKRILKDIVYPTLRLERVAPSQVDIAVAIATSLRLHAADAASVAVALVERMKTEKDSRALGSLGGALGALSQSGKLEGKDVQPGLEVLDRAIKSSTDQGSMQGLIRA